MKLAVLPSLQGVAADAWDALTGPDHPFVEHAFLLALEQTGSVGPGTSWMPAYLVVVEDAVDVAAALDEGTPLRPLAAAPCYLKGDSWGEFVFDWQWAEVFALQGKAYYPKLVCAVPFTPATGRRLLVDDARPAADALRAQLVAGLAGLARQTNASSAHALFLEPSDLQVFLDGGFAERWTLQHQFHNRDAEGRPYPSFDAFLASMRAPARKAVRRERRIAASHGLTLELRWGHELSADDWARIAELYRLGCARYGSPPYLDSAMFAWMRDAFAERVRCSLARDPDGRIVAMTLNFEKQGVLYGRYWGAEDEWPMLHFELAYYRLIEDAITRGLGRLEAGSGGGHKLRRGLQPTLCRSAHLVFDPELGPAIRAWLERERRAIGQQRAALRAAGTERRDGT